jgi:DNA-binding transcriptional regulator YbjK
MRESLRLMERREAEDQATVEALRHRFIAAEADVAAGTALDYDDGLLERLDREERSG